MDDVDEVVFVDERLVPIEQRSGRLEEDNWILLQPLIQLAG